MSSSETDHRNSSDRRHRPGRDGVQHRAQLRPPRLHRRAAQPLGRQDRRAARGARFRGQVRPQRDHPGIPCRAGEAAPRADHGQGRRPHRRRDQRARRRDGGGRHHHRWRQRPLHRHHPPREGDPRARPALRRRRHLRRRGGRAQRPVDHARRSRRVLQVARARCSRRSPRTSTACRAARTSAPTAPGHFVKMVHNGIEYSDMQLIGEAYQLLRDGLGKTAPEIADVFAEWNKGDLDSYLIEITAEVLKQVDAKTGKPLVDVILDEAEQKGTGRWTVKSALDLGVPVTGIAEAVFARALSGFGHPAQGHHRPGLGRPRRQADRRRAVHRRRQQGAVRVEDHRLRPGLQPDSGGQRRIRLGHHPRRHGHHLARRLHHPGQVPQPDQGGLRRGRASWPP